MSAPRAFDSPIWTATPVVASTLPDPRQQLGKVKAERQKYSKFVIGAQEHHN